MKGFKKMKEKKWRYKNGKNSKVLRRTQTKKTYTHKHTHLYTSPGSVHPLHIKAWTVVFLLTMLRRIFVLWLLLLMLEPVCMQEGRMWKTCEYGVVWCGVVWCGEVGCNDVMMQWCGGEMWVLGEFWGVLV